MKKNKSAAQRDKKQAPLSKKITTIFIVIIIIAGLGLVLYPTVSDLLKTIAYHQAIVEYQSVVEAMDDSTYEEILRRANEYNEKLLGQGHIRVTLSDEELADYNSQMNVDDSGIMGYVVIQKINVSLPIYHGTGEAVLQSGAGHLEGSSLPVGGKGTHSVLSGHRGLPSAMLFTNIDQMVIGDTFTVRVLREVLTYEVDEIKTVLPNEVNAVRIEEGQDYCTLLTCTPYGVNSHRLLVRGHRIPTPAEEMESTGIENQVWIDYLPLMGGVALIVIIMIVIIIVLTRRRKRKMLQEQQANKEPIGDTKHEE